MPGQILGAGNAHSGVGQTIRPAGVLIEGPIAHKTCLTGTGRVSHGSKMVATSVLLAQYNDILQNHDESHIFGVQLSFDFKTNRENSHQDSFLFCTHYVPIVKQFLYLFYIHEHFNTVCLFPILN